MATTSTSPSMIPVSSNSRVSDVADPSMLIVQPALTLDNRTYVDGPVAILWDIENCPVPSDVRPEDVGGNIRMALRVHPVIRGAVTTFSAYGDFNSFPRRLREGCQRTGVKLIDVPNGRKDAADKAILVDMFLFALDNPPPSSILLISGDVDFAPALHILGQRGYTIILVIPSGVGVSSALTNAGKYVWDWPSVARGEGFVPPAKSLVPPRGGSADITAYIMGCLRTDSINNQNDDEAIVYRGISQSYYNSRDFSVVSQSLQEYNCSSSTVAPGLPTGTRSQSLPPRMDEVSSAPFSCDDQYHLPLWVQPGDISGLKVQLVKLLEQLGGCLPLICIPAEYQKIYGRPLCVSEYGAFKLVDLFNKMGDAIVVDGKGQRRFVYLKNWKAGPSAPPVILRRKDRKGKGFHEETVDAIVVGGSSEEISDEERVVVDENDEKKSQEKNEQSEVAQNEVDDQTLEQFKYELQEILVSYISYPICLGSFKAIYQQRYKKPLDYQKFGVDQVEDLFDKLSDVVVLLEEPTSRKKFLLAVGG